MINLNVAATCNKVLVLRTVRLYVCMGTESFEFHYDVIITWNCVALNKLSFTSASQWKSHCQFVCLLPVGKNKQQPYKVINTKKVRIFQFLKQEHDGICVQKHTEKSSSMKQKTWTLDKGNKHSFSRALV